MLHSSKRLQLWKNASCGLTLVALKRTGCDVWQMECQASNVTANDQSDHLLHGYILPVFFATDRLHRPDVHHAELKFSWCGNAFAGPQLIRITDWYSIRVIKWKRWKICAFYKVVWWHFSGVVVKTRAALLSLWRLTVMCFRGCYGQRWDCVNSILFVVWRHRRQIHLSGTSRMWTDSGLQQAVERSSKVKMYLCTNLYQSINQSMNF